VRARLLGHAALAAAHVAGDLAHDLPEGRPRHRLQHAGAAAALAGDDRRPGSAPLPWQRSQVSMASKLSSTSAPVAAWAERDLGR
jgi:hypothetical protein